MTGPRLAVQVRVLGEDGDNVLVGPGPVPRWAADQITNPSVWEDNDGDGDAAAAEDEAAVVVEDDATTAESGGYNGLTVAQLKALIGERNTGRTGDNIVPTSGHKAELVAALEHDDGDE